MARYIRAIYRTYDMEGLSIGHVVIAVIGILISRYTLMQGLYGLFNYSWVALIWFLPLGFICAVPEVEKVCGIIGLSAFLNTLISSLILRIRFGSSLILFIALVISYATLGAISWFIRRVNWYLGEDDRNIRRRTFQEGMVQIREVLNRADADTEADAIAELFSSLNDTQVKEALYNKKHEQERICKAEIEKISQRYGMGINTNQTSMEKLREEIHRREQEFNRE